MAKAKPLSKSSIQKMLKDSTFDPRKVGHMAAIVTLPNQRGDWKYLLAQAGYQLLHAASIDEAPLRSSTVRDAISMAAAGRVVMER